MASSMLSGTVKWFNSKHKYGFITVTSEGEYKNVDLFVHQSNLNTKEPCYRFLIAGENVKFEVKITNDEKHPSQAVNVSELNGGSLKCEVPRQQSNYSGHSNSTNGGRGDGYRGDSFSNGGRGGGFSGRGGSRSGSFSNGGGFSNGGRGGGRGGRGGAGGDFGRSRFGVQDRTSTTTSVNTDTVQ
jgi:cold shock CspA family protein